ncbi:MAG: M17 family peptidase N-terminal domain-containing protein [Nitrospiria bacterium]
MRIEMFSGKLNDLQTDLLAVTCFEDIRPLRGLAGEIDWLYGGILSRVMMQNRFSGELGKTILLASEGKLPVSKILLLGLGTSKRYGYPRFKDMSAVLYEVIDDLKINALAVDIDTEAAIELDPIRLLETFREGKEDTDAGLPWVTTFIVKEGERASHLHRYIRRRFPPKASIRP